MGWLTFFFLFIKMAWFSLHYKYILLDRMNSNLMNMDRFAPVAFKQIHSKYPTASINRCKQLLSHFQKLFGIPPQFIMRAPGRVNIIGEHIDYEGYGVLPAAIWRDCLIAVRKSNSKIIIVRHMEPEKYPNHEIKLEKDICMGDFPHQYLKYLWAGLQSVSEELMEGAELLIGGNIPTAAGLSSSSALCVCSALVSLKLAHQNLSETQFIEAVIRGERQTGTASGGMDQTISVMGKQESCLFVEFQPLKASEVKLPSSCSLVIVNSLERSAKLETAVHRYNKRVCECRLASKLLEKELNLKPCNRLVEVHRQIGLSLSSMLRLSEAALPNREINSEELSKILGDLNLILQDIPLHKEVLLNNLYFHPLKAARHVFSEAQRVAHSVQICKSNIPNQTKIRLLGGLMTESHTSCSKTYNCSTDLLDTITATAVKFGAHGSRLTGAGWGGCTVSLVDSNNTDSFVEKMRTTFLAEWCTVEKLKTLDVSIEDVVFATTLSPGACIFQI